jgi:hypothetical protein
MTKKRWTADDIPDQSGRVTVVTGANSGIGFETARALAWKRATVVIACRNPTRGIRAVEAIHEDTPDAVLELRWPTCYSPTSSSDVSPKRTPLPAASRAIPVGRERTCCEPLPCSGCSIHSLPCRRGRAPCPHYSRPFRRKQWVAATTVPTALGLCEGTRPRPSPPPSARSRRSQAPVAAVRTAGWHFSPEHSD